MRVIYYSVGWFLLFASAFACIRISFLNPDMTSARVLIEFWYDYLCAILVLILGLIWINFADRIDKNNG